MNTARDFWLFHNETGWRWVSRDGARSAPRPSPTRLVCIDEARRAMRIRQLELREGDVVEFRAGVVTASPRDPEHEHYHRNVRGRVLADCPPMYPQCFIAPDHGSPMWVFKVDIRTVNGRGV